MMDGAVTEAYNADRQQVVGVPNDVLATEIVCILRYGNHFYMAKDTNAEPVAQEFLRHANEKQMHADWVSVRIAHLGGTPNWNPEGLVTRAHADDTEGDNLIDMIKEDLVAERIAIETYSEINRWLAKTIRRPDASSRAF